MGPTGDMYNEILNESNDAVKKGKWELCNPDYQNIETSYFISNIWTRCILAKSFGDVPVQISWLWKLFRIVHLA